jgi:hypothetical protein
MDFLLMLLMLLLRVGLKGSTRSFLIFLASGVDFLLPVGILCRGLNNEAIEYIPVQGELIYEGIRKKKW